MKTKGILLYSTINGYEIFIFTFYLPWFLWTKKLNLRFCFSFCFLNFAYYPGPIWISTYFCKYKVTHFELKYGDNIFSHHFHLVFSNLRIAKRLFGPTHKKRMNAWTQNFKSKCVSELVQIATHRRLINDADRWGIVLFCTLYHVFFFSGDKHRSRRLELVLWFSSVCDLHEMYRALVLHSMQTKKQSTKKNCKVKVCLSIGANIMYTSNSDASAFKRSWPMRSNAVFCTLYHVGFSGTRVGAMIFLGFRFTCNLEKVCSTQCAAQKTENATERTEYRLFGWSFFAMRVSLNYHKIKNRTPLIRCDCVYYPDTCYEHFSFVVVKFGYKRAISMLIHFILNFNLVMCSC